MPLDSFDIGKLSSCIQVVTSKGTRDHGERSLVLVEHKILKNHCCSCNLLCDSAIAPMPMHIHRQDGFNMNQVSQPARCFEAHNVIIDMKIKTRYHIKAATVRSLQMRPSVFLL